MLELLNHEFTLTMVEVNPDFPNSIFNIKIFGNISLIFVIVVVQLSDFRKKNENTNVYTLY